MELEELLKAIKEHPGAISLASGVLDDLNRCVGGQCPVPSISESAWKGVIQSGEHKLVHQDPSSRIYGLTKLLGKSADSLPAGTICTFDCVVTTTKKDRDGDVLETGGAIVDPKLPLLWQHMSYEPIGGLSKVILHNSKRLKCRMYITGTQLGQDAAMLVEAGALRISHGFRPIEWERMEAPKEKSEDDDGYYGFRFKKFEIMEVSLVSVPANSDAVIEAFSKQKLTHPLVKAWAGAKFRERPVIVPGADIKEKACGCHKQAEPVVEPEAPQEESVKEETVEPQKPKSTAEIIAEILTNSKTPLSDLKALRDEHESNLRQVNETIKRLEEAEELAEAKRLCESFGT